MFLRWKTYGIQGHSQSTSFQGLLLACQSYFGFTSWKVFPNMGAPPNHPCCSRFPIKNHPFVDPRVPLRMMCALCQAKGMPSERLLPRELRNIYIYILYIYIYYIYNILYTHTQNTVCMCVYTNMSINIYLYIWK